jgi:predicted transposase YbfD/YdcC
MDMGAKREAVFDECFSEVEDPRIDRKKLYPLSEILFVVICGSICGAESWRDFVIFGNEKLEYLKRFFAFENGIPSKNTFARVMSIMNPEQLKDSLVLWIKTLQHTLKGVVAIDGKTVRRSFDKALGQNPIHIVSAFASELQLTLGQEKVRDKSNEITAIPKLLELLDLVGSIVTIDAMGCQKEIAKKIREKEADYILALKGNQHSLHDDVKFFMETEIQKGSSKIDDFYEDVDKGHGRVEIRKCYVSSQINWLSDREKWKDMNTIIMLESSREIQSKTATERRFYISSLPTDAKLIINSIREHWGVENKLHWVLDMTFREDESRIRKDHAPENMALIRRWTLNMLKTAQKEFKGISLKALRKKAGWGNGTLDAVLQGKF